MSLAFVITPTALAVVLLLAGSACKVSRSLGADPADVAVRLPSHDAGEILDGSLPGDAEPILDGSLPSTAAPCWDRQTSQLFRRALCTCRDLTLGSSSAPFLVDAFDSSEGPYSAPGNLDIHAAVGVNRVLETAGAAFKVSGDLTVTSLYGLTLAGSVQVLGDLSVRGVLRCNGELRVEGDAWLEGGYEGSGLLTIGGDRIMPPATSIDSTERVSVGGSDRREPIAIEPPCACDSAAMPDLNAAIRSARTENDNAANGFDSASLENIDGQQTVPLAGRVYSTGLHVSGMGSRISFMVEDKVSLFIDGDLVVEGGLRVELGAAGELDLFVAGHLTLSGSSRVGNVEQPARVRVYVASAGSIRIAALELGANLYAPRANVVLEGSHALYGSVVAEDFTTNLATAIHYDAAGMRGDARCVPTKP